MSVPTPPCCARDSYPHSEIKLTPNTEHRKLSLIKYPDQPGAQPVNTAPPAGPLVQMKMRPDLSYDRQSYQGVEYWVIKEPLGQKYFQLPPPVFFLLKLLDGHQTIDSLQDAYHAEYAPKRITRNDLQQLLTRFHQDSLVTANVPGQGSELLKRGQKNRRMELFGTFSNILAIRWKGVDPENLLNWLNKYTWWIFTPAAAACVTITALVALLSVLMNWTTFQSRLPGFEQLFDPNQWYLMVIVLAGTKIMHEFGHGLSCKRLGGECHEIGFMLLVLTPCLYCNVSDSWRLNNKWHRAAIGAAGMYVEVILATIATFVWWFAQPGLVQELAVRVMLVSSISTILFNGNPLLRFDGYYILSDILEIPNLNQKSTKALTTLLGRHWLGLEIPDDQLMPTNRPWAFALFTVAAFCYRWLIMFSIIYFLTTWLEPYGLESVGVGIALFSLIGMVGMPGYKLYKYMSVPGRMHQVKKLRFFTVLAAIVGLATLILAVPLPHNLRCQLVVLPQAMETVYVEESGQLASCEVKPGEQVEPGQVLARLQNIDLQLTLNESAGQIAEKKVQKLAAMTGGASTSPEMLEQLATINSELRQLLRLHQQYVARAQKLEITSSIAGTVLPTPYRHPGQQAEDVQKVDTLPLLHGNNENVAAIRGQRFCEVADLSQWHAIIFLSENQIKFATKDQDVKIRLHSQPDELFETTLETLGETDQSIHRQDYDVPEVDPNASQRLPDLVAEMVAAYQLDEIQFYARAPLQQQNQTLKIGLSGEARLFTGYRSLGARLWWWINQNFRS